jgi:thymidylate synthase (FAD)
MKVSKASLIWATPDIEAIIAYCARVSNPANQHNTATAPKLLKYCMDNGHWSVFEMGNICIEIECTRDIARQILRHRSFSFQEFSQRYALVEDEWESTEARAQDPKNRQNSIPVQNRELQRWWHEQQVEVMKKAKWAYGAAIEQGIAKEVARKLLPEGLTMSRMYVNGTARSWLHYIDVRCDKATQKEHRDVAEQCKDIVYRLLPSLDNRPLPDGSYHGTNAN